MVKKSGSTLRQLALFCEQPVELPVNGEPIPHKYGDIWEHPHGNRLRMSSRVQSPAYSCARFAAQFTKKTGRFSAEAHPQRKNIDAMQRCIVELQAEYALLETVAQYRAIPNYQEKIRNVVTGLIQMGIYSNEDALIEEYETGKDEVDPLTYEEYILTGLSYFREKLQQCGKNQK